MLTNIDDRSNNFKSIRHISLDFCVPMLSFLKVFGSIGETRSRTPINKENRTGRGRSALQRWFRRPACERHAFLLLLLSSVSFLGSVSSSTSSTKFKSAKVFHTVEKQE